MSDIETCTICLDQLFDGVPVITRLQPCGHYYHSQCINPWKERSNTCPTCRNNYDILEFINDSGAVVSSLVADKIESASEDDLFESLSDIQDFASDDYVDHRIEQRIEMLVADSNICILCDIIGGRITACNSCSSTFHLVCLGLGGSHWICPMCDAEQGDRGRRSRFRRSRNSAITDRVYHSLRASGMINVEAPSVTEEVAEAEPMSIEEQHAWESFEIARETLREPTEASSSSPPGCITSEVSEVPKKFKRPSRSGRQPVQRNANPPRADEGFSQSLVNTIICQIKEHRPTTETHESRNSVRIRSSNQPGCTQDTSPMSISPSQSPIQSPNAESFSPASSSPDSTRSNKTLWKMTIENETLSLEQKQVLQEIVRTKLRPLYKDGIITFDQYTVINKKVSHILYNRCLSYESANPDFEAIADYYVTQEIMEL